MLFSAFVCYCFLGSVALVKKFSLIKKSISYTKLFAEKCTYHRYNIFPSVYPSDPIIPHSLVLSQSPRNFWSGELFSRNFCYFDRPVTLELQQSALQVTCSFFLNRSGTVLWSHWIFPPIEVLMTNVWNC